MDFNMSNVLENKDEEQKFLEDGKSLQHRQRDLKMGQIDLQHHVYSKAAQKSYECPFCMRVLTRKYNLKKHIQEAHRINK